MKIVDLSGITIAASAGLCGVALAFSPSTAAAPLPMGGPNCMQQMAGVAPPAPVVLPGPPVAAGAVPA
ncbi:MAG: hypothetical protein WCB92_15680, partial [Mycobacterium sp.]